ncbi:MAG: response regulator [Methanomassiliicoccales archaeon]
MRALIADGDEDFLSMAEAILWQVHSIETLLANCAEDLFVNLREYNPDAIIINPELPDMKGAEALKIIRAIGKSVPFIILIPRDRDDLEKEAIELGAVFYLKKCSDPALLINELGNMIEIAVKMGNVCHDSLPKREAFEEIILKCDDMILVVDKRATVLFLNPAGTEIICVDGEQIINRSIMKIFHRKEVLRICQAISHCLSKPGQALVLNLLGRRGEKEYVQLKGKAFSPDGKHVIFCLTQVPIRNTSMIVGDDIMFLEEMSPESRKQRQKELARELTFRLISRILVDRMSENERSFKQNRFRFLEGLPFEIKSNKSPILDTYEIQKDDVVMKRFIDGLANRIDLMEIVDNAKLVEEANRNFYGPD